MANFMEELRAIVNEGAQADAYRKKKEDEAYDREHPRGSFTRQSKNWDEESRVNNAKSKPYDIQKADKRAEKAAANTHKDDRNSDKHVYDKQQAIAASRRHERRHGSTNEDATLTLSNLRAFAYGTIDESVFRDREDTDGYDFENDEEFIQECMNACLPIMVQAALMEDSGDVMDENTRDAFQTVAEYFAGQGVISESAVPRITNQKINVVHLSKAAQLKRLTSIITLKMARKDNSVNFKKYKMGCKIKKDNMSKMRDKYGTKADKLARKLMLRMKKHGKVAAVIDSKKEKK